MTEAALICPVCREGLIHADRSYRCKNSHCFDVAKEGYVNLLRNQKNGDLIGDSKESARCRRDFLNKGYYAPLKDGLIELFRNKQGKLLDICCGEGYYTSSIAAGTCLDVYGFDISKEMIRLASKRGGANLFVANLSAIPVADASFDFAIHLFAPFQEKEFCRVLKDGGSLYSVIPGKNHLYGLKKAVYDTPYFNDEQLPETSTLKLVSTKKITADIHLACPEDIMTVFQMTPYYYHTSQNDKQKLAELPYLDTEISFVIAEYKK